MNAASTSVVPRASGRRQRLRPDSLSPVPVSRIDLETTADAHEVAEAVLGEQVRTLFRQSVPVLLPALLRLLTYGSKVQVGMAAMLTFFGLALTMVARNGQRSMTDAFRLRFENAVLLQRISRVRASLETANRRLSTAKTRLERRVFERTAELRKSEHQLAEVIRQSPDGIMTLDEHGAFIAVNPAVEQLTGYSADELLGRSLADLAIPSGRDYVQLLQSGYGQPFECELNRQDGKSLQVEINPRTVARSNGHRQIYAVVRDITARRDTERAKEQLESQLRQAQRLESVGLLAGGVAHDFNNVLTVISSNLDAIDDVKSSPEQLHDLVEDMRHATGQAARLTNQLLAFSRQQVLDTRVVDVNRVIEKVDAILRRVLSERSTLTIATAEQPATVLADPTQLEQVLINLVLNARDAMPNGGTVHVAVDQVDLRQASPHSELNPGAFVRLTVEDTGTGMDQQTLGRVFEPFFTTKGPTQGTGLGLSTVHGIVKQSRGHITVESQLGRGTRFEILLPYHVPDQPSTRESTPRAVALRGDETVLLVEDQAQVRLAAERILQAAGYHVLTAPDGEQALELARQHDYRIDLLVTDAVMPGIAGQELSRRMLQHVKRLSVLVVSGYTPDPVVDEQHVYRVHFLQKPFNATSLTRAVRDALELRPDADDHRPEP